MSFFLRLMAVIVFITAAITLLIALFIPDSGVSTADLFFFIPLQLLAAISMLVIARRMKRSGGASNA